MRIMANTLSVSTVAAGTMTESDLMYGALHRSFVSKSIESSGFASVDMGLK